LLARPGAVGPVADMDDGGRHAKPAHVSDCHVLLVSSIRG
jgi:hypothetical protein